MVRGNSHGLSTLLNIPSCSLACPKVETRWARNHDFIGLPSLLGRFETSQSSHSQGLSVDAVPKACPHTSWHDDYQGARIRGTVCGWGGSPKAVAPRALAESRRAEHTDLESTSGLGPLLGPAFRRQQHQSRMETSRVSVKRFKSIGLTLPTHSPRHEPSPEAGSRVDEPLDTATPVVNVQAHHTGCTGDWPIFIDVSVS